LLNTDGIPSLMAIGVLIIYGIAGELFMELTKTKYCSFLTPFIFINKTEWFGFPPTKKQNVGKPKRRGELFFKKIIFIEFFFFNIMMVENLILAFPTCFFFFFFSKIVFFFCFLCFFQNYFC